MKTRPILGIAAASTLLLSGCGTSAGLSPGVAAQVGEARITVDRVEEIASAYCSAIEPQLEGQVLPNRYLTSGVAGQLALAAAAEQLGEEHGATTGEQYQQQLEQLEAAVETLPEEQREAVIEVESAGSLVSDIVVAVGTTLAEERGAADAGQEQVAALGNQALATWIEENDVEVNPRYGIELRDGQPVDADTATSVAVSEVATAAAAEAPDAEYAATLPESQRCG